jgi:hypothetical protein
LIKRTKKLFLLLAFNKMSDNNETMMPDPKWLEILKASGPQTTALAFAFGAMLLVIRSGYIVSTDEWFTALHAFCWLAFLVSSSLSLASISHVAADFLEPRLRLVAWLRRRQQRKAVRNYIPFMTDKERKIIAYLLHYKQKTFTAASDGGFAATLISRQILVRALAPGQMFSGENMPLAVPDHVWDVLAEHKDQFPYSSPQSRHGVEPSPWRVPWMAG